MSRIYVDRISPYQSGSVQVDGLSLDTSSLATKVELNAFTASQDSLNSTFATTGSNTFNGGQTFNVGDFYTNFKINGPSNTAFYWDNQGLFAVADSGLSNVSWMSKTLGFNTYDTNADVGFNKNLNDATSQGDDRPGIYSYSGSVATDVIALPKKSWDGNGTVEFKTPLQANDQVNISNNLIVSQSGANHEFSGNSSTFNIGSGNFRFRVNGPNNFVATTNDNLAFTKNDFTAGALIGQNFGYNLYDSAGRDFGYSLNINTSSGTGVNKIGFWGTGQGGYHAFLSFEDNTNWTDGRVQIHKTLQVDEVLQLQPQDPLPTGALGQLAVSGSDLYFHNGTNWIVK